LADCYSGSADIFMPYQAISKIVTEEDLQAVKAAIACIKANQLVLASLTIAGLKPSTRTTSASLERSYNPLPLGQNQPRHRRDNFPAVEFYRSVDFVKGLADLVAAMEKLVLEIEAARPAAAGAANRGADVFDFMRQAQSLAGASRRFSVDRFEARD
jgi:hypothetical protein